MNKNSAYYPQNKYAFFIGAGISKNSGIPLASEVVKFLLRKLPIKKEDLRVYIKHKIPFELFIQTLKLNIDVDGLLDIFSIGKPNLNHIVIAKMAKEGIVKVIYTTNFDILIETALKAEKVSYIKYYKSFGVEKFEIPQTTQVIVVKLHGCISDRHNLSITLEQIANKVNVMNVKNAMQALVCSSDDKVNVFAGYSFSDHFDINLSLENIKKLQGKTIAFMYSKKDKHDIKRLSKAHPLEFLNNGYIIQRNMDAFVKLIWSSLSPMNPPRSTYPERHWQNIINDWLTKYTSNPERYYLYMLCGKIMSSISYHGRALYYYEICEELSMKNTDSQKLAQSKILSAISYRHTEKYDKALSIFSNCLKLYYRKNKDGYAKTLCEIGTTYRLMGNYPLALKYQKLALRLFNKAPQNTVEILKTYICIGNVYVNQKRNRLAYNNFKKAQDLFDDVNDIVSEAVNLNSIISVNIQLGRLDKAHGGLQKVSSMAKKLGVQRILIAIENNWGVYYDRKGNLVTSLKHFEKAYKLVIKTNDSYQTYKILKNLIEISERNGNFEKAIFYIDKIIKKKEVDKNDRIAFLKAKKQYKKR